MQALRQKGASSFLVRGFFTLPTWMARILASCSVQVHRFGDPIFLQTTSTWFSRLLDRLQALPLWSPTQTVQASAPSWTSANDGACVAPDGPRTAGTLSLRIVAMAGWIFGRHKSRPGCCNARTRRFNSPMDLFPTEVRCRAGME